MQQIDTITPEIQQLIWFDRDEQVHVVAESRRASDGALHIEQTLIDVGLPVTIGTHDGWMKRSDFNLLVAHNKANLDDTGFMLTLGVDSMRVMWDNSDGAAISGRNLRMSSKGSDLLTNVVMKFITVI